MRLLAAALLLMGAAVAAMPAAVPPVNDTAVFSANYPQTLAEYGFFTDTAGTRPAAGVIPYRLNTALWSDGAVKTRFLYLPPGMKAKANGAGLLDLPVGAALIKSFAFGGKLMETTDEAKFAAAVPKIDAKIRPLMNDGQSGTLWRLRCTLEMIAGESSRRAPHATLLLRTLGDTALLGPIAEKALAGFEDREGTASKLVARAGKHGAYALYAARLKHATFEPRERFVTILHDMGAHSLVMITAALERLESRLSHPGATALAEDLLKALPGVPNEATAAVVARYARSETPALALVATAALPKVAGVAARPVLLGLFDHTDDGVSIAAIKGLRALDIIDLQAVKTLEPLIRGELSSRMPPRIAAVEALAKVRPEATVAARALLTCVLQQTTSTTPDAEDLVVVASTALIAIGGDAGLVAERWRKSTVWLKTRLETVLKGAPKTML